MLNFEATFRLFYRNFTIDNLIPRFLHVKPKAKPDEINPFIKGIGF